MAQFYLATYECFRFCEEKSHLFNDLASVSDFLCDTLRDYQDEETNGVDADYINTMIKIGLEQLTHAGGRINIDYGEVNLRCTPFTQEELLERVTEKINKIGHHLH